LQITENQTRSVCYPGSDKWFNFVFDASTAATECTAACVEGTVVNEADTRSGGVWTGGFKLLVSPDDASKRLCFCELHSWCPDENIRSGITNPFRLRGLSNWTISVKQAVRFHKFEVTTVNNVPKNNPIPPIFTVAEVLEGAGLTLDQVRDKGATIVMETAWDCDLDHDVAGCNPKVSFVSLGAGYNFRRLEFDKGIYSTRQLIKHYGIRLIVSLSGQGSRFDAAALFTAIGAGIGLLAVASLVADFVAVNLLGHRDLYERAKFRHVEVKHGAIIRGKEETRRAEQAMAEAALETALRARKLAGLPPLSPQAQAAELAAANAQARKTVAAQNAQALATASAAAKEHGSPPTAESGNPLSASSGSNNALSPRGSSASPCEIELMPTSPDGLLGGSGSRRSYGGGNGLGSGHVFSDAERAAARRQFVEAASHPALALADLPADARADDEETGEGAHQQHGLTFAQQRQLQQQQQQQQFHVRIHGALDGGEDATAATSSSNSRRTVAVRLPRRSP